MNDNTTLIKATVYDQSIEQTIPQAIFPSLWKRILSFYKKQVLVRYKSFGKVICK